MTNKELKTLLKTLRTNGVVSYKAQGVEVLLDPNFVSQKSLSVKAYQPKNSQKELQEQVDKLIPQMSDNDWLLATNSVDPDSQEVPN